MQNSKSIRIEINLNRVMTLIENEAPGLLEMLETEYQFKDGKLPSKMLKEWAKITENDKYELFGWINAAIQKARKDIDFFTMLGYINLTTAKNIEIMTESVLENASIEQQRSFEGGYKSATAINR